ncbi:MAG: guanylate kinase [Lachnospira sp.]|nr:guanylate kinase [Lachnospira sp.]
MPKIAFIMGKSASGKDKIYKHLVEDETLNLNTVTMYTTRPMRVGEVDGEEYYFVSDEQAHNMEQENRIIEMRAYDTVYGIWKYFTADDGQIDLNSGKRYIVIGTLEAYDKFCSHFGKEHILPIYIEVDDGVRLQRALHREMKQENPKYDELCRRFLADSKDFSEHNINRSGIKRRFYNNEEITDCIAKITEVINEELK